ncbi:MAG: hypothetical protein HY897_12450 [Deltaproteobacteria bacterium]|nr:hypothetical protein [Deltaproteobacteria bacterium]
MIEKERCPEMHELIGFFESNPSIESAGEMNWPYQCVTFLYSAGVEELNCTIWPIECFFSIVWRQGGKERLSARFHMIRRIQVENRWVGELLTVQFDPESHVDHLILRLKPHIQGMILTKEY